MSLTTTAKTSADPVTYGAWKVTEEELTAARRYAYAPDATRKSDTAYQVVRYCNGLPFYADDAREWLKNFRLIASAHATGGL